MSIWHKTDSTPKHREKIAVMYKSGLVETIEPHTYDESWCSPARSCCYEWDRDKHMWTHWAYIYELSQQARSETEYVPHGQR